ncbi:hypothetical protein [Methylacidiphilum kamchatkense]|nr:hypothetical protein [Methylacidiphilum kamchatkense]
MILLVIVLFFSGIHAKFSSIFSSPTSLVRTVIGLCAAIIFPPFFLFIFKFFSIPFSQYELIESIFLGLAIVSAMPVAGFSTVWSQYAGGNVIFSLQLVLFTTFLSPLFSPWVLQWMEKMISGSYALDLHAVIAKRIGIFLLLFVIFPTVSGSLCRCVLKDLKLTSVHYIENTFLLLLCYANSTASLPKIFQQANFLFLLTVLCFSFIYCFSRFYVGNIIGWLFHYQEDVRKSLVFGTGMSNTGSALVLANLALSNHPRAIFVILLYDVIQLFVGLYMLSFFQNQKSISLKINS